MVDLSKGAVHVMVSPELKTIAAEKSLGSMESFQAFITKCLAGLGANTEKVPDNMLFRFAMDRNKMPEINLNKDNSLYFKELLSVTGPLDVHPSRIVSLREADFCLRNDIPLLSPDAEHQFVQPAIKEKAKSQKKSILSRYDGNPKFPMYKYVQTEIDSRLFTLSPEGKKAYLEYLQTVADTMLDRTRQEQTLRVFDIPANMIGEWRQLTRPSGKNYYLANRNIVRDGIMAYNQEIKPNPANLQMFVKRFAPEGVYMPQRAYDYASLTLSGSNAMESFQHPHNLRFSYEPLFKDMNRKIAGCGDLIQKAELYISRKKLADEIIKRDFPDSYQIHKKRTSRDIAIPEVAERQSRGRGL